MEQQREDARLYAASHVQGCRRSRPEKQQCRSAYRQVTGAWSDGRAVTVATWDVYCEDAAPAVESRGEGGRARRGRSHPQLKRAEERPGEESAERAVGA